MTPQNALPPIAKRLIATADRIAGLRTELQDECETRDRLVLEAMDLGYLRRDVGRWAQVHKTRVTQIVAEQAAVA